MIGIDVQCSSVKLTLTIIDHIRERQRGTMYKRWERKFGIAMDNHRRRMTAPVSSSRCLSMVDCRIRQESCMSHPSISGLTRVDGVMYRTVNVSLVNERRNGGKVTDKQSCSWSNDDWGSLLSNLCLLMTRETIYNCVLFPFLSFLSLDMIEYWP